MKATVTVNKRFEIGKIDERIYGSFVEHLGRAVYHGIYEPTNKKEADEDGFRRDVIKLVREIDVPITRYPGGNFVSGYNWQDGIGDPAKRPRRMELAWQSIETNEIGLCEFAKWAEKANTSVMMAVNLGTAGPKEAQEIVEYCNSETDTYYANLRREHGYPKPFGFKLWCLGNEMDANWQIGKKSASEYGRIAREASRMIKNVCPYAETVISGSSNINMKTFGEWELGVLEEAYESVDYISLHNYYHNGTGDASYYFADSIQMDEFIKSVASICDAVKAKKKSKKQINLSFDEWNIWYNYPSKVDYSWQIAPPIIENTYTFEDAITFGCLMMTLQNNCDRVKIACVAQLVNVIAPIMTENDGKSWKQTIFYPYALASNNGRGTALRAIVDSETYTVRDRANVPYLATSVINNEEEGTLTVFAVNRSLEEEMTLSINAEGFEGAEIVSHTELYSDDLKATNTKDAEAVVATEREIDPNSLTASLRKHSWNMIKVKYNKR